MRSKTFQSRSIRGKLLGIKAWLLFGEEDVMVGGRRDEGEIDSNLHFGYLGCVSLRYLGRKVASKEK